MFYHILVTHGTSNHRSLMIQTQQIDLYSAIRLFSRSLHEHRCFFGSAGDVLIIQMLVCAFDSEDPI